MRRPETVLEIRNFLKLSTSLLINFAVFSCRIVTDLHKEPHYETFQQSGKQDYLIHIMKSSAGMCGSSDLNLQWNTIRTRHPSQIEPGYDLYIQRTSYENIMHFQISDRR